MKAPCFFLGIGATSRYNGEGAADFIRLMMKKHDIVSIAAIGTLEKQTVPAFLYVLAETMKVPLRTFSAAQLERKTPRLKNVSSHVFAAVGCHGVAEAAALALGGHTAELIIEKTGFEGMTVAIAGVRS